MHVLVTAMILLDVTMLYYDSISKIYWVYCGPLSLEQEMKCKKHIKQRLLIPAYTYATRATSVNDVIEYHNTVVPHSILTLYAYPFKYRFMTLSWC